MILVREFVRESNRIEGITRAPTKREVEATDDFLEMPDLSVEAVLGLQVVYAPGKPLRMQPGMNVRVGRHIAPPGGPEIRAELEKLLRRVNRGGDPFTEHVAFEKLHPFMDGNGRTGRAIWAWSMISVGQNPFALPFLHRWYYQSLADARP